MFRVAFSFCFGLGPLFPSSLCQNWTFSECVIVRVSPFHSLSSIRRARLKHEYFLFRFRLPKMEAFRVDLMRPLRYTFSEHVDSLETLPNFNRATFRQTLTRCLFSSIAHVFVCFNIFGKILIHIKFETFFFYKQSSN